MGSAAKRRRGSWTHRLDFATEKNAKRADARCAAKIQIQISWRDVLKTSAQFTRVVVSPKSAPDFDKKKNVSLERLIGRHTASCLSSWKIDFESQEHDTVGRSAKDRGAKSESELD